MCQSVGEQQPPLVCQPRDTDVLVGETSSGQMTQQLKQGVTCRECWRGYTGCCDVEHLGLRGSSVAGETGRDGVCQKDACAFPEDARPGGPRTAGRPVWSGKAGGEGRGRTGAGRQGEGRVA